jgi:hypothetical protein
MVLEVAAAITGIIAAAGKVLEVVSPMLSSFQNVDSLVAKVHAETNQIRIILPSLKAMLDDLESMISRRKEIIIGHQFSQQNEQEQVVDTFLCGGPGALSLHSMAFSLTPASLNPQSLANLHVLLVGMVKGTVAQALVTTFDGKTILLDDTVVKMHIQSTDYLTKHTP